MTQNIVIPKPDFLENDELEDILEYLDRLRESGEINMFAAPEYVKNEFGLDRYKSRKIVTYWMNTFTERHPDE